ncbi:MAG: histidinol-phosphate aminotransferase [Pseudomonadota bacterium]
MNSNDSSNSTCNPAHVIKPAVQALHAYQVAPAEGMVKLDVMESPYRLPLELRTELARELAEVHINRYPDPRAPELVAALRQAFAIDEKYALLVGNGSDEIISIITQAIAEPGTTVMSPEPSFVMFKLAALQAGANFAAITLNPDFSLNLTHALAAIQTHQPKLLWLVYPNNPTGNLFPESDLRQLIDAAPGLVVIDEAYYPFARCSMAAHLATYPNLIIMRTVSKMGMAGLRIGYVFGRPEWIREFDKVRSPYNVSNLTQAAATFALKHLSLLDEHAQCVNRDRDLLLQSLQRLPGITAFPSKANFVLVRFQNANAVYSALLARHILVRHVGGGHPLLHNCLRLSVGTPEENRLLLEALADILSQAA